MRSSKELVLAALLLAACGSSSDSALLIEKGYELTHSGDYSGGLASFERALAALEATDDQFVEANMGRFQALAHVALGSVSGELLGLADAQPGRFGVDEFRFVASHLRLAEKYTEAVHLLHTGIERFEDDDKLHAEMKLTEQGANSAGDSDAMKALKTLGYAGG